MNPSKHVPADDAPAGEWAEYLKSMGFLAASEPRPVGNYREWHGYWVPPRVGAQPETEAPVKRAPRRKKPSDVDARWYTVDMLVKLFRADRKTFEALRERLDEADRIVALHREDERVAGQRTILESAVEAGLMGQAEADARLAEWARGQGINLRQG